MKALALMFFASVASPAIGQTTSHSQPPAASPLAENLQDAAKPTAKISPEKEAAIRRLMDASGMRENLRKVLAGSIENIKPVLRKSLPPGEYQEKLVDLFFERFQQKMKLDDMLDLVVPVYDKHFSIEDIEGLTKFYQTPLGKKALSNLAEVMLECQAAGAKYGEQAGREAMTEVLAEHPEIQKALEEAGARKN